MHAAAPVRTLSARPACALVLAKQGDETLPQGAAGRGVDRRINRLVRHVPSRLLGMLSTQCAADLIGRVAPHQESMHAVPQRRVSSQLAWAARLAREPPRPRAGS